MFKARGEQLPSTNADTRASHKISTRITYPPSQFSIVDSTSIQLTPDSMVNFLDNHVSFPNYTVHQAQLFSTRLNDSKK